MARAGGGNGLVLNDCNCGDDVRSAVGFLGLNCCSSSSEPLGLKSSSTNIKSIIFLFPRNVAYNECLT